MTRSLPTSSLATLLALAATAVLTGGCGEQKTIVSDGLIHPQCADSAWLDVVALDVWGRSLNGATITGAANGQRLLLTPGQTLTWDIAVDGFLPSEVRATWSGEMTPGALDVSASNGAASATSLDVLDVTGLACRVYTVFVGLDHAWYAASGRAPRAGNEVTLLMDGEDYWGAVYDDLTDPARTPVRVHQTTWWWQSDFELIRPDDHPESTPEERRQTTMLSLLEQRGGENRLMVARFSENTAPGMAYMNTDPALRAHGTDPNDGFEVMLQSNPVLSPVETNYEAPLIPFSFVSRVRANPAHTWRRFHEPVATLQAAAVLSLEVASFHQKALTVDHDIAYISGMNVKSTDWDTSAHLLHDPRRMRFGSTFEARQAVVRKEALPDLGPRKDYGMRIRGPAARDLDDLLRVRWDYGLAVGAMFEGDHTPYDLLDPGPPVGDVTAQVVATMPDPVQERSILETLIKATRNAQDFIYIEDQYWRVPVLHAAIHDAMTTNPDLYLVVVTKPVAFADGGKKYTVLGDEELRNAYPDRYLLLQLQVFGEHLGEPVFVPMDVHSKIQFVDDAYVNLGSANKNNRGLLYEGELNVAVYDPAFVTPARTRVLQNLVGPDHWDAIPGASGRELFTLLKDLAEANEAAREALLSDPTADVRPQGFVYPLVIEPGWLLEVGPDLF